MLQHVSIETRRDDADACARFYELVGFREVEPPATLAGRATWLERDGTQIHLMFADDPVIPPKGHHAVVVSDYDAALSALRAAGFDPEPRDEHWGAARSFVTDPAGHVVELMAAPPPRSD
jgi:catechol 2,3-dioxygenase-like lactoylglutathione lyase family enzyme